MGSSDESYGSIRHLGQSNQRSQREAQNKETKSVFHKVKWDWDRSFAQNLDLA